jgi:hypothetical protein
VLACPPNSDKCQEFLNTTIIEPGTICVYQEMSGVLTYVKGDGDIVAVVNGN